MQQDRIPDDINLNLAKMIPTGNLEEQCVKISNWLKRQYPLDGIGFFLKNSEATRAHFFTETITPNMIQDLEEMLLSINQTEAAKMAVLFFAQKEEGFVALSPRENPGKLEPTGLIFQLGNLGDSMGDLVLVSDPVTIQELISKTPEESSFVPLISSLLKNALSHEQKDSKIRMRSFWVVLIDRSRCKRGSMPSFLSSRSSSLPSSSAPTTESSRVREPSAAQFQATLAAPPSLCSSPPTRTTGTGASGEIRDTSPIQ